MNKKYCVRVLTALLFALSIPANSAIYWSAQQITNNSYRDSEPVLSDTHVAWMCRPSDNTEICSYNGTDITQLTNSTQNEQNLSTSEKYIAWNWRDSVDGDDIFLYDGTTLNQLTDTSAQYRPYVNGERMVWGRTGGDVILYDIATQAFSHLVPPGSFGYEYSYSLSSDSVALTSNQGSTKLYLYDITLDTYTYLGVTSNEPKVNEEYVVFDYYSGDLEIRVYDKSLDSSRTITNNSVTDGNIQIRGQYLVWSSDAGATSYDDELYLYDLSDSQSLPVRIANNVNWLDVASIDGNLVVYSGWDGNDWEIYVYDIDEISTQKITHNIYADRNPKVRSERIVWDYFDGLDEDSGDNEIMLAIPGKPPEGDFFIIKPNNGSTVIIAL